MTRRTPGSSATRRISWSASIIGYDKPQPLGKGATGGGLAAPIFKEFMKEALEGTPIVDFHVPEGMKLIAINRKTGMQASEGEAGTIMEAFKPGTGPADSYWVIGMDELGAGAIRRGNLAAGQPGDHAGQRRPVLTSTQARLAAAAMRPCCFTGRGRPTYVPRRSISGNLKEHSDDMRTEIREPRRRNQAGHKPAEEASLTGIRQSSDSTT